MVLWLGASCSTRSVALTDSAGAGRQDGGASSLDRPLAVQPDARPRCGGLRCLGELCAADSECQSGMCAELGSASPKRCTAGCTLGGPCPAGGVCLVVGNVAGLCLAACAGQSACPAGTLCATSLGLEVAPKGTRGCVPAELCTYLDPKACAQAVACRCEHYSHCGCECPAAEKQTWLCDAPLGCQGCPKDCYAPQPGVWGNPACVGR